MVLRYTHARLKQEDYQKSKTSLGYKVSYFQISLGYSVRPCLTKASEKLGKKGRITGRGGRVGRIGEEGKELILAITDKFSPKVTFWFHMKCPETYN